MAVLNQSVGDCINKLCYIYIMEYNVALKEMRDVDVLERSPWY